MYLKRFLSLALEQLPEHKKYTKDIYINDRAWITRVSEVGAACLFGRPGSVR